jgi:hypothetical protein
MKTIFKLVFFSSIMIVSAIAALAQAQPPKPSPPGTIPNNLQATPVESWQEFKHEAGNFSVMMPGKPVEVSQMIESDVGKVPIRVFTAPEGKLIYLAMYAEYPIAIDTPGMIKTSLNNARDLLLIKSNGKLINETDISLGKYTGRELKAKGKEGAIRSRIYIVNQRMYMLAASAEGAEEAKQLDTKKIDDFFGSFKFLKEPQPIEAGAASMSRFESEVGNLGLPLELASRPVSWREVPSPEFGFTVWMPSEPSRKKIPLNPNDQRLDISLWMAMSESSLYQVIVQPMLAAPNSDDHRNILFRSLLEGLLGGGKLQLEGEKPISFEGYPGREYKLRTPIGLGTGRAYIVGNVMYLMLAFLAKKPFENKDDSAEVARFFDSFRLTKAPDAAPVLGSASIEAMSWREIVEPEHGFKIQMPGEPKKETSYDQGVSTYILVSVGYGLVCVVSRHQLPPDDQPESEESFYEVFIGSYTKSGGLDVTGATDVVLDGRKGREYKLKKNEDTGAARVFLIGHDIYCISAIAVLPEMSKQIPTFLDSFKLIEKSPNDPLAEPPSKRRPLKPATRRSGSND